MHCQDSTRVFRRLRSAQLIGIAALLAISRFEHLDLLLQPDEQRPSLRVLLYGVYQIGDV